MHLLTALALVLFLLFAPWAAVGVKAGLPDPDSLSIKSVRAFGGLLEAGDVVLVMHYNIAYATLPAVPASKAWVMRWSDDTGGLIAEARPYPYHDGGYGEGIVALYLPASRAPTWGGTYKVTLQGDPAHYDMPPVATYTMQAADWDSSSNPKTALAQHLVMVAQALETTWGISLTTSGPKGIVLNVQGQEYILATLPGASLIAPDAFPLSQVAPDYSRRTWTGSYAQQLQGRWTGTWWLNDAFGALGRWLGVSASLVLGILTGAAALGAVALSYRLVGDAKPGFIAGAALVGIGTWLGFLPMQIAFIMVFLAILGLAYALLWAKS